MKNIGNLFHLASKQLYHEIKINKRKIDYHNYRGDRKYLQDLIYFYGLETEIFSDSKGYFIMTMLNLKTIVDYAILIRKELDRLDTKGKIKNIYTGKLQELFTKKEKRHYKYIQTGY